MYHYKDAEKCFRNVKKHLYKNSLFIIEMFNPDPKYLVRDPNKRYLHNRLKAKSGLSFKHTENNIYDKTTQINHNKWYYKFNGVKKEQVKHLYMRLYYPQEFEALLDYNGFKIVEKFGCHNESKLHIRFCQTNYYC